MGRRPRSTAGAAVPPSAWRCSIQSTTPKGRENRWMTVAVDRRARRGLLEATPPVGRPPQERVDRVSIGRGAGGSQASRARGPRHQKGRPSRGVRALGGGGSNEAMEEATGSSLSPGHENGTQRVAVAEASAKLRHSVQDGCRPRPMAAQRLQRRAGTSGQAQTRHVARAPCQPLGTRS